MLKPLKVIMTVVWAGLALFEAIHDLSDMTWGTLSIQYNWVGLILIPLFLACASAVWSDQLSRNRMHAFGVAVPFVHGLMLLTYNAPQGWIFVIAAVILGTHVYAVRKLEASELGYENRSFIDTDAPRAYPPIGSSTSPGLTRPTNTPGSVDTTQIGQ